MKIMSSFLPTSLEKLIKELSKLPSIGQKTASRLAIHLLKQKDHDLLSFSDALKNLKKDIIYCSTCFNISESNPCAICTSDSRKKDTICVVQDFMDVFAIENTHEYKGLYHVLHGSISPIDGIGPNDIKIHELKDRIERSEHEITEIIIATNPNMSGEATAVYISNLLKPLNLKISRIGRGLPVGGDLEYADEMTLVRALEGRSSY